MDTILQLVTNGIDQIFGRAGGPLNFRLVVMPIVVTLLALRADRRDARERQRVFLGALITDRAERRRLFRSALKDIGKIFAVAVVLDITYQLWVFRWVYPLQVVIVAVTCAVVPYVLVRGPITRLARFVHRKWAGPAHAPAAEANADAARGKMD